MTATSNVNIYSTWQHDGDGHDYVKTTVAVTCTGEGYDLYTCSICGENYKENVVAALGHSYGEWVVATEATCTEDGLEYRICSACGNREEAVIEAAGHSYVSKVTKEATCTAYGEMVYTCENCGDIKTEQVEMTKHEYKKVYVSKSWLRLFIEKLLNIFFGYEGDKAYYFECENCHRMQTSEEAALTATASAQSVCVHSVGEAVVILEATTTEKGAYGRYCTICGNLVEVVVINETEAQEIEHNEGKNGLCTICGEFVGNVRCDAAALALEGQIGLVFYYRFSSAVLDDENAYVLFTYENGTEVKYLVSQMTKVSVTGEDYELYRVVCEMAAQDMFQTITAEVVYTIDGTEYRSNGIEYGVMTYYKNKYSTGSKELRDLLDSLLAYGDSARIYFQSKTAETSEYTVKSVAEDMLNDYAMTSEGTLPSGVTAVATSLILESVTSIKVYIQGDITGCVVTVDDVRYEPTLSGDGMYEVVIGNISSSELDHMYTICISDGVNQKTYTYSAMSYVRNKLSSGNQNLVQLVCALYYYNQAANVYFK
jgi:hypothetical protein